MIKIDGAIGEGGGQILRSAIGLSLVTQTPVRIENIRAGRRKPGLLRQHLTAVKAAKRISNADVRGDALGSTRLEFRPGRVQGGVFAFGVGTAGSTTLVLQTILPALMTANTSSTITIEGGTHNPYAPPFPFLNEVFVPMLRRMGVEISLSLDKYGFYPAGGGCFRVAVKPVARLIPLTLEQRGVLQDVEAVSYVSNLDVGIAERELHCLQQHLTISESQCQAVAVERAQGPGNIMTVLMKYQHGADMVTAFGEPNKRAEKVAAEAATAAKRYMSIDAPVGVYLADQLMVPFAMAGEGVYVTGPLSRHARTNLEIVRKFRLSKIDVEPLDGRRERLVFGKLR